MITEFIKHIILKKPHPREPAFVNREMNIVLVLKIVELAFEKKHSLLKQPTFRDATTDFPAK